VKTPTVMSALACGVLAVLVGCGSQKIADGTPFAYTHEFAEAPKDNPPKMILFTTISPQW